MTLKGRRRTSHHATTPHGERGSAGDEGSQDAMRRTEHPSLIALNRFVTTRWSRRSPSIDPLILREQGPRDLERSSSVPGRWAMPTLQEKTSALVKLTRLF